MAMVAGVEAVMVMAGDRGRFVLVVMRVAMVVVRMVARDRGDLRQACGVGDRRAESQHRQRKQADQQGSDGRDSVRHHRNPYKRTVKAR